MALPRRYGFETTRWSLVIAAAGSQSAAARDALAALCEAYWYPLYAFVRRQGYHADEAEDAVQSFIALLLEREDLKDLTPERGRLRAFLLVSLRNFLQKRRVHDHAQKRGGGRAAIPLEFDRGEERYLLEPTDSVTPETVFDRSWALAVLDRTFGRIRAEWEAKGKGAEFDQLKDCLMGEWPDGGHEVLAVRLRTTPAGTKMAVHRLRRRFQQELRSEIADTVTDEAVEDEMRYLLRALQG
jgi:RNA polymerase sigma-70 factor (ECF subfamily)